MSSNQDKINITFFLDENSESNYDSEFNVDDILKEIGNTELYNEIKIPQIINYHENFTVKELIIICDYYGFAKEIKSNKYNKEEIIHFLVEFENNPMNNFIVSKRQNLWFYINELKNDKFMKKYLLWS
jgi:hypothetical protein